MNPDQINTFGHGTNCSELWHRVVC